jgi:hypothetical protein
MEKVTNNSNNFKLNNYNNSNGTNKNNTIKKSFFNRYINSTVNNKLDNLKASVSVITNLFKQDILEIKDGQISIKNNKLDEFNQIYNDLASNEVKTIIGHNSCDSFGYKFKHLFQLRYNNPNFIAKRKLDRLMNLIVMSGDDSIKNNSATTRQQYRVNSGNYNINYSKAGNNSFIKINKSGNLKATIQYNESSTFYSNNTNNTNNLEAVMHKDSWCEKSEIQSQNSNESSWDYTDMNIKRQGMGNQAKHNITVEYKNDAYYITDGGNGMEHNDNMDDKFKNPNTHIAANTIPNNVSNNNLKKENTPIFELKSDDDSNIFRIIQGDYKTTQTTFNYRLWVGSEENKTWHNLTKQENVGQFEVYKGDVPQYIYAINSKEKIVYQFTLETTFKKNINNLKENNTKELENFKYTL